MGHRIMIAIIAATVSAATAVGQTRSQPGKPAPSQKPAAAVVLPTEPSRAASPKTPASLREAAEANDYSSFDGMVRKARDKGEDIGAYADLYDVWLFAESTATGAYYGTDIHDRLAARYPEYTKFIEEFRISDSHGHSFYPTAETRAFLLRQAIEGNDPLTAAASKPADRPAVTAQGSAAAPPAASNSSVPNVASPKKPSALALIEPPETLPSDALASDMSKVVAPQPPAAAQTREKPVEAEMVDTTGTPRGIFLIILGLVGIGVLTITMRAPSSESHLSDEEPHATPGNSHG